jgi:hypothetical protein
MHSNAYSHMLYPLLQCCYSVAIRHGQQLELVGIGAICLCQMKFIAQVSKKSPT